MDVSGAANVDDEGWTGGAIIIRKGYIYIRETESERDRTRENTISSNPTRYPVYEVHPLQVGHAATDVDSHFHFVAQIRLLARL